MKILCPKCKKELFLIEKAYKCENKHSYDLSKEGYLNLNLKNSQNTGDNQLMIKARRDFLEKGYYDFLRIELDKLIKKSDSLIDLACGEGYYTSFFKAQDKIGIDLSKTGLKIASKNDKSTLYLLNSIFHNPLEDKCADKIITIFAPIAKQEIVRLLKDDGLFILVKPDEYHLYELKQVIYDKPYLNEVDEIEIDGLKLSDEIKIQSKANIPKQDLMNLFLMTPYYNTSSKKDKDKLNSISNLDITLSFIIDVYQKSN